MRPLRLVVNWFVLLSAPIWGGFYIAFCFLTQRDQLSKEMRRGQKWFWQ